MIKLRMLFRFYLTSPVSFYHDIWKQDPDVYLCCNGWECGCMGSSHRDLWEHELGKKKRNGRKN